MDVIETITERRSGTEIFAGGGPKVERLIRRDQLEAIRRSVSQAVPVNALLGVIIVMVAASAGEAHLGLVWFSASTVVNLLRLGLSRAPCHGLSLCSSTPPDMLDAVERSLDRHMTLSWIGAFLSGVVWAFLALLCDGFTSPHTPFYLTVICGCTAGAATYGMASTRVPICFIAPPLSCVVVCLLYTGGVDRDCLAATVLLYLIALARGAAKTEAGFHETARLKYEAKALARSSEAAHADASALANEMRRRATHDGLSGLLNRAGFVHQAENRLSDQTSGLCLMLLDLDGFKAINDIYGHQAGDRVLVEVARRLRQSVPPQCLTARLGGDEFAILYDPTEAGVAPTTLAAHLVGALAKPFETLDAGRLGMSVGIYHAPHVSLTHMLSCADEAMYMAKRAGRNQFRVFDDRLRGRLEMRRDSERDICAALAEGLLEVWFQPILGRHGRVVTGLEALVRWRHPVHGWIPPGDIISAASASGLTETLLRFILDKVCAMMGSLADEGLRDVQLSMNVSPREMAQIAVDEIVLDRLRTSGLSPALLEIEITEETVLDIHAVQAKLFALSQAGVRVALDDFGTGYSSLASLRQLRVDRIKIDRSLVTDLTTSADKRVMVQAVLGIGRSLGLDIVAEGVETADDLGTLQALGCPFMQGYYFGRPAPAKEAMRMVAASYAIAA